MKTWLKAAAYREPAARFLLRYGRYPGVLPAQSYFKEGYGQCYRYSYTRMRYTMDEQGVSPFKYMIGIAMPPSASPKLHAWNILEGMVFDTTWKHPHGIKYCGVEIGQDLISFLSVVQPRRTNLGLFMEFEHMWPYLENYCHEREQRRRKMTGRA